MEYYVADSYKNFTRDGEPFEKDGKMYTKISCKCDRCGGTGVYAERVENGHRVPHPAYGGVCLKCDGTGLLHKVVRLYTEREIASMHKAKEKRAAKAAEIAEARRTERKATAYQKWLGRNGFNSNGTTFLIYGNTYPIKDELKAAGYKFSQELKWHGPAAVDIPEDCFIKEVNFSDLYTWDNEAFSATAAEGSQEFLQKIFQENVEGEYVGEIGERLRDLPVTFESGTGYEGKFGHTYVYTFSEGSHIYNWFTQKWLEIEENSQCILTGTVKDHKIYGNKKVTYLNRCIVKEV